MKNRILTSVALATSLMLPAAYAQSSRELQANIPFQFRVGPRLLPAGAYSVAAISQVLVLVRSLDCKQAATVITQGVEANQAPTHGKLVFQRYGDAYFLSQVWRSGEQTGIQVPESKTERGMRREMGKHGQLPVLASIAIPAR